jgi:hypothetical protein
MRVRECRDGNDRPRGYLSALAELRCTGRLDRQGDFERVWWIPLASSPLSRRTQRKLWLNESKTRVGSRYSRLAGSLFCFGLVLTEESPTSL